MSGERKNIIDWEHLIFLSVIVAFLLWYLWDATTASPTFSNLILIAPAGAGALILAIYIGIFEIAGLRAAPAASPAEQTPPGVNIPPSRFREGSFGTIVLLMLLFALFVAAIPYAGFDIASFVFIVATLWLLGERRVTFALLLALAIAAAVSIAALLLLAIPMPMGIASYLWGAL
jgi:hypothetical protein